MTKNSYIIIRIATDTRTNSTAPRVVFAETFPQDIAKNNFKANHAFTNKRKAVKFAAKLTTLFSDTQRTTYYPDMQVQYKVFQIKEVA